MGRVIPIKDARTSGSWSSTMPAHQFEWSMRHGVGGSTQIILKVAEVCNIACTYCYFYYGDDDSYKTNPAYISRETIDAFARFLKGGVDRYRLSLVTLILHGGEPLMLKPTEMEHLLDRVAESVGPAKLRIAVQTNAMLVNARWIDLFEKYNVSVGVSLDGPSELNDLYRVDKKGRGTHSKTLAGVEQLMTAAKERRISRPALLSVINPESSASGLYEYFVEQLGFRNIDFLLPTSEINERDPVTSRRIARFVEDLLSAYQRESRDNVNIRLIDKAINALTMPAFEYSHLSRFVTQKDIVFAVSSFGDIRPDDTLRVNSGELMETGLNVHTSTFSDVLTNPRLNYLVEQKYEIPTRCAPCDFAQTCGGGDLSHRFGTDGSFDHPSVHCEALKTLHSGIARMLLQTGLSRDALLRRLTAVRMEVFRDDFSSASL